MRIAYLGGPTYRSGFDAAELDEPDGQLTSKNANLVSKPMREVLRILEKLKVPKLADGQEVVAGMKSGSPNVSLWLLKPGYAPRRIAVVNNAKASSKFLRYAISGLQYDIQQCGLSIRTSRTHIAHLLREKKKLVDVQKKLRK